MLTGEKEMNLSSKMTRFDPKKNEKSFFAEKTPTYKTYKTYKV